MTPNQANRPAVMPEFGRARYELALRQKLPHAQRLDLGHPEQTDGKHDQRDQYLQQCEAVVFRSYRFHGRLTGRSMPSCRSADMMM